MAARLPLILSQPSRCDATAVALIENIVAAAMLLPKLDANLVGDLSSIDIGSTDHLCLQGHSRDIILVSFLDLDQARATWQRLDQTGHFVDCSIGAAPIRAQLVANSGARRVFYFQLTLATRVSNLLDKCQELVAAQSLSLVSIQLGAPASGSKNPTKSSARLPIVNAPTTAKTLPLHSETPHALSSHLLVSQPMSSPAHAVDDVEDWTAIDQLVDDLDALDL